MILKDMYNFVANKCPTFVKDAYIFVVNKYSNVVNSTYNFVNQLFNLNIIKKTPPKIVEKTPPKKDLIKLTYIDDNSSKQNKGVVQLDVRIKDGRYVRSKYHSQSNSYEMFISRLEKGQALKDNYDKIRVDANGKLLDATFGKKGVSQLDVFLFKKLLIVGKTGSTPEGSMFEVTDVSQVKGDGNCGFRAIVGGEALSSPGFNREWAINLIINNLYADNGITKNLINNDIKALYQEW